MFDSHIANQPQVKDLPRDTCMGVTCRSCGLKWGESVHALVEDKGMGAEFVDLLEWKYRCIDPACGGMVRFTFDREVAAQSWTRPEVAVVKPLTAAKRPQPLPYPVKAVVKPRSYAPPMIPARKARGKRQLSLPLPFVNESGVQPH